MVLSQSKEKYDSPQEPALVFHKMIRVHISLRYSPEDLILLMEFCSRNNLELVQHECFSGLMK